MGAVDGQSVLFRHTTHAPSGLQSFPGWLAQSALLRHATQLDVGALQRGVSPEHCASVVQPGRHVKSCGSHTGRAAPQSELSVHWTHWPSATRQRGLSAGQSAFVAHATHCDDVGSHTLFGAWQFMDDTQPTHAPGEAVEPVQIGVSPPHMPLAVQAAWHVWSPGQHDGIAAGQSVFDAQAPHCPLPAKQNGVGIEQSVLVVQSTQPSAGLHCLPMRHWLVPLTPQSALPGPGPEPETDVLLPPHAMRAPTMSAVAVRRIEVAPSRIPSPPASLRGCQSRAERRRPCFCMLPRWRPAN
jgi:hypothetical protein